MKKIFLFSILFTIFAQGHTQGKKKIVAAEFVKIVETSNFSLLVKLVKSLSYEVADSTKQNDGSLIYISGEKKVNGNILGCTMAAKGKMNHLSFSTFDKPTYDSIRKQLKGLGFKSSGIKKRNVPEVLETEDFEKGNILVGVGTTKKDDDVLQYEFTFMKW